MVIQIVIQIVIRIVIRIVGYLDLWATQHPNGLTIQIRIEAGLFQRNLPEHRYTGLR